MPVLLDREVGRPRAQGAIDRLPVREMTVGLCLKAGLTYIEAARSTILLLRKIAVVVALSLQ